MTKIELFRTGEGQICGFDASGHAGYADHGEDIVCAAISAITQTALLGLMEGLRIDVEYSITDGNVYLQLPDDLDDIKAQYAHVILDTMRLGLLSLSQEQPRYVVVSESFGAVEMKH